jgi:hypothetical protein
MTSVPILIGGAAGATGSVATKLLLQMGFPVPIVRGDDDCAQSLRALRVPRSLGDTDIGSELRQAASPVAEQLD